MSNVQKAIVKPEDADMRLDRWFKKYFPDVPHGRVEKLLRTGQARLNSKRAKGRDRIHVGDEIRIPPLDHLRVNRTSDNSFPVPLSAAEKKQIKEMIIAEYPDFWVLNKPSGLAVQGGTKTKHHVDRLLAALIQDNKTSDKPKLVHRLDKHTAGVLLVAKTRQAAKELMHLFQQHKIEKTYIAVVAGVPENKADTITLSLSKQPTAQGEKVRPDESQEGKKAVTEYKVLDQAGERCALVAFKPVTGRMHQIRVHAVHLGTPIVGDGKYGARKADLQDAGQGLHLCAHKLSFVWNGRYCEFQTPLPAHMQSTLDHYGLVLT